MKTKFILIATLSLMALLFVFQKDNVYDKQNYTTQELPYQYSTITQINQTFDMVKVSPENIKNIKFYYTDSNKQPFSTIENLQDSHPNLIFIMNGGIFSKQYKPLGLYIENSKVISELNINQGKGNFYFQPNGIFQINDNSVSIIKTQDYQYSQDISNAIQSGPLLIIDGEINSIFNKDSQNRYIRNGIGIDQFENIFFIISNQPVTFYEFAMFFQEKLNCDQALYLDGAISEMYIPTYRQYTEKKI